jgi:hypothetical protein
MDRTTGAPGIEQDLPGAELVAQGLADLHAGVVSLASLLVEVGAPRLRGLGLDVPQTTPEPVGPEMRLYRLLWSEDPRRAHSRYNALIRRLVSFERALELRRRSLRRQDAEAGPGSAERQP